MSGVSEEDIWYPDEDIVVKIHNAMLEKYGGWRGFERGVIVFRSILDEMKAARGVRRKAAILLRRMVTGRIFEDGNHRTGQAVTETFLEMNNAPMRIQDSEEIIRFIKNILQYDIDEIEAWLKYGSTQGSDESIQ